MLSVHKLQISALKTFRQNTSLLLMGLSLISHAQDFLPIDSCDCNAFNLEEIVVTGTRVPKLLKDTPVQTRLINSKDIERTDATDIQGLLQA